MRDCIRSYSEKQTRAWGERIGRRLVGGEILALQGNLGAGKTCLVKGIARGMGIDEEDVVSPTYTLIREIEGPLRLFHIDLYRLEDPDDLENIGFYDAFEKDAVTVIEWPDRFFEWLPEPYLLLELRRFSEEGRELEFRSRGDRFQGLIRALREDP
ncbi:MAG: tRNA (adenosine(37)-N6)-threonylcarbamoyltransferase complex ATPase subunit type 1 TsaE [Deltaproteobacteria bacterium]|nr:tRNA (adenosine(37)-N6)-threonylcarbamoyltransferase complex ATPase subunit type 1 TsaE [Deltaproteobacteria bacterium]